MGLAITGVLHAIEALTAQQLDQKAGQIFRPGPHNDLLRIGPDAPETVQVFRDRPAQPTAPCG